MSKLTDSKYVIFDLEEQKSKTKVYGVRTKSNLDRIGEIKWNSGWRRYWFMPDSETGYDSQCLKDIATFMDELMEKRNER